MSERHPRPRREMHVGGPVEHHQVGTRRRTEPPEVGPAQGPGAAERRGDRSASSTVRRISRTATAMQNGIELVGLDPGLQLLARATVAPASSARRASA